ncbi:unnamed protein product [Phytophthora lilii]|uniref:Unnamed protein product n=1 Tax=Phytophthora lilii TaxID=2077276 RepID=A0A9W6U1T3_9STRA|nr:unnamed protein product [Phytophthora lilii]
MATSNNNHYPLIEIKPHHNCAAVKSRRGWHHILCSAVAIAMQDHLHFGAPPKLRPRTAGASRSSLPPNEIDYGTGATSTSTSASAPERLASAVNALKQSPSLLVTRTTIVRMQE